MRVHLLALIILAVVVAYLVNSATEESAEETAAAGIQTEQQFDYYMNEVESTHFSNAGRREYLIQTSRLTHYPSPEYTTLQAPDITFYPAEDMPWFLSAERGRIEAGLDPEEERIVLSDNVRIFHTDGQGQTVRIFTDYLLIYPDRKYLTTDRDVRMESGSYRLSSTGMTADLESRRVRFLDNVRGRYE